MRHGMRYAQAVFVDSGAWIALALSRDPLRERGQTRRVCGVRDDQN